LVCWYDNILAHLKICEYGDVDSDNLRNKVNVTYVINVTKNFNTFIYLFTYDCFITKLHASDKHLYENDVTRVHYFTGT